MTCYQNMAMCRMSDFPGGDTGPLQDPTDLPPGDLPGQMPGDMPEPQPGDLPPPSLPQKEMRRVH